MLKPVCLPVSTNNWGDLECYNLSCLRDPNSNLLHALCLRYTHTVHSSQQDSVNMGNRKRSDKAITSALLAVSQQRHNTQATSDSFSLSSVQVAACQRGDVDGGVVSVPSWVLCPPLLIPEDLGDVDK